VIDNDKKKSSLYFYGPTGSGKTHLVHAIRKRVNELFPGGYAMTILNYTELQSMKIEEIMDLADSPHIVAIDDLGARSPSEYSIDVLYRLLNRRYEYMLPTIITSNLPTEKLTDIFGDRISSRIDRMSIPHEVS
jgi:DNA replication protein DnaC